MPLINRISRLFAADFHAVLDNLEEPQALLKHAIREMEESLRDSQNQLDRATREVVDHERQIQNLQTKVKSLNEDLDICLEAGNEELARSHVRRKLEAQRLIEHLDQKFTKNKEHLAQLRETFETNNQTLTGLKQKAELFKDNQSEPNSRFNDKAPLHDWHISSEEIETALLGEKKQRAQS